MHAEFKVIIYCLIFLINLHTTLHSCKIPFHPHQSYPKSKQTSIITNLNYQENTV